MTALKNTKNMATSALEPIKTERLLLFSGILLVLTFISFYPSLKNNFINWDDNAHVFENQILTKSFPEAAKYFFGQHTVIGNYIPLTMMVYFIEHHFAGLNPKVFHAVSLFFHLLNVLLVFWFTILLSQKKLNVAFIVALFFGIHPMHVESVAWISAMKDLLYSFFFLLGLIFYYKYLLRLDSQTINQKNEEVRQTTISNNKFFLIPISVLVFFLLSLLSKPAAIVFPLILLTVDYYAGRALDKRIWIEKIPYFLLSIVFGIIAYRAQAADRLLHDDYSMFHKIIFASHSFLQYITKFFIPTNFSIFYPYPLIENGGLTLDYFVAPLMVFFVVLLILKTLKTTQIFFFGFLFFTIHLILVLQIISIGDAIFAERYTYLSYLGPLFVVANGYQKILDWLSNRSKLVQFLPIALASTIAICCVYISHQRCKIWKNDDSIATDLLKKHPNDRLALNNKGFILMEQGRHNEAIELFRKAVTIRPDYVMARVNLTNAYLALNDFDAAVANLDSALVYAPNDFNLLNNKALFLFQQKKYSEATVFYKRSLAEKKDAINVYINLAECYYTLQEYDNVIATIDKGLSYEPNNYILLNSRGYMYFLDENYTEAINFYNASLRANPNYEIASANLKNCYQAMKQKSR